jgi:ElaB/YqjD/DUF883 family membrane-anchored ribosome-binding protein
MADVLPGSPRPPDAAGTGAQGRQDPNSIEERRDRTQGPGQGMRDRAPETPRQEASRPGEPQQRLQETALDLRNKAQELATQGKEAATEYYQEGREQARVWQQQLEGQVRQKPLQSILIAAGIGLLFGMLRRR